MVFYQTLLIILSCIIIALIILLVIYRCRSNSTFKKIKTLIENLIIDTYDNKDETSKIIQKNTGIYNKQMLENYIARLKENIDTLLRNSQQKTNLVNLILNNVSLGILIIDNNRRIIRINESLMSLFYLDKIKIIDNKTIMVFNNENFENLISKSFNNLEAQQERITFFGDEDISLDIVAIPITPECSIVTKEDIKKLRDMRTKINLFIIIRNITQEIEFSKLRSQFVANISHEMKTPLTSIKGYTETAIEDDELRVTSERV
jgi:two-component system phosphate regulon sensor histidine kinase PhoR